MLGGSVAAVVAVLVVSVALGSAGNEAPPAPAVLSATELSELQAKGQRIVVARADRDAAHVIRLQTASYADGSTFDLAEERGNVVILYFMAAWCTTCIPEAQALAQLHERYAEQGVRIIVLDVDQTENERHLADFRERTGNGQHLWAMDTDFQVAQPYNVRFLDSTIVIDREGRIAYIDFSPTEYETLAAIVEALLR